MPAPSLLSRPSAARLARSLALAATLAASPALAQMSAPDSTAASTPADSGAPAAAPAPRGPTLDGARAGVSTPRPAEQAREAAFAPGRGGVSQPAALMIVGGAAVVVGLLVGNTGGDLLAFGGAIVGLVGLYQYLR